MTLKIETLNPVRSFKGRGTETVAAVARRHGASRLVCASAGNLGQALAYSGARRGLEVTVVAARSANPLKLRQIAAFGAAVRLEGDDIEDAPALARQIAEAEGAYLVEDSLDLATCEGAATMGLELIRDDPKLDVVLVALGGGAMASGIGYVMHSLAEHAEVIGIQPVGAPAMALSWRQRTVVETERIETIADGVAGRCPIPEVLDDLLVVLDDVVLVREDSIKVGMRGLHEHAGLVVEPSAPLASPPSSRTPNGSPGGASPRSCAEAMSGPPTSPAGSWNRSCTTRVSAALRAEANCQSAGPNGCWPGVQGFELSRPLEQHLGRQGKRIASLGEVADPGRHGRRHPERPQDAEPVSSSRLRRGKPRSRFLWVLRASSGWSTRSVPPGRPVTENSTKVPSPCGLSR